MSLRKLTPLFLAWVSVSAILAQDLTEVPPAPLQIPEPAAAPDLLNPQVTSRPANPQTPAEKTNLSPDFVPDLLNPQTVDQAASPNLPIDPLPLPVTPEPVGLPFSSNPEMLPSPLPPNEVDPQSAAQNSGDDFKQFSEDEFPGLFNENQATDLARHSSYSKREGFTFAMNLTEIYSSNLLLSETDPQDSFQTQVGPSVTYRSSVAQETRFSLVSSYSPSFNFYHDNSNLNELSHAFDGKLSYSGAKTTISLGADFSKGQTANRFTQTYTETSELSLTADLRYKISPKTSLNSQFSLSSSDQGAAESSSSDSLSLIAGASWQVTPLTRMGPSVRYATSQSGFGVNRDSLSLLGTLDYEFSGKTSFNSTFGVERVSNQNTTDQTNPTGTLSLNYRPTKSWKMSILAGYESISTDNESSRNANTNQPLLNSTTNAGNPFVGRASLGYSFGENWSAQSSFSLRQGSSPISPDQDVKEFTQDYSLTHRFGVSSLSAGLAISTIEYQNLSSSNVPQQDDKTNTVYLSYIHPSIFRELSFRANVRHTENSGRGNYEETSISLGLGYQF